jgi:CheY-like chemotaxis protein
MTSDLSGVQSRAPSRPGTADPVNRTVLYIEDDADNIGLVERLLHRRPQIDLRMARNGRDGVASALQGRPGLILLDNRLPDATGRDGLRDLASSPATAAIPVLPDLKAGHVGASAPVLTLG